jgi:HSP20 family molecular chaperone IbpA
LQYSEVFDEKDNFHFFLEIPGSSVEMTKSDSKSFDWTIRGEKAGPFPEKNLSQTTQKFGSWERKLKLPDGYSSKPVKQTYEDGILHLVFEKKKGKPQPIVIKGKQ